MESVVVIALQLNMSGVGLKRQEEDEGVMLSTTHLHFGPVCLLIGFGCKLPDGVDR